MKRVTTLALTALLFGVLLWSCSQDDSTAKNDAAQPSKQQPQSAPKGDNPATERLTASARFADVSVVDLDGNRLAVSEWVGKKPVVVNFWGTWCPPCRREIPALVRLYDEFRGQGVEIISLAIERNAGPQQVRDFGNQAGMVWVMAMSNDVAAEAFGLSGSVPTTIFYDAAGREVARHVGSRTYEQFKGDFSKIAGS